MLLDHPDICRVTTPDGREVVLIGTAHISRESVDLAREAIEQERPDAVCLELDAPRFDALAHPERFAQLDLREVMRRKQLPALILNLVLASYQRRLGQSLGVNPGEEMLQGARSAEALGLPIVLADRDVRITLRRAWHAISWWRKVSLLSALLTALLEDPEMTEDDLRSLRRNDAPTLLAEELSKVAPGLRQILLDERDIYLADKIRTAPGTKIVALIGAGHLRGVEAALRDANVPDLATLEEIPPLSPLWHLAGWSVPALIIASIAWIGWTQGIDAAGANSLYWILVTGIPCALGAVLSLAHPATIVTAFVAAPITTLTPVLGAGYATAFAQLYFRPPLIGEIHDVPSDIAVPKKWWSNRLLQVFLVFLLTSIGASIGTFVGGAKILRALF